mgnify:CR=1 FL=1
MTTHDDTNPPARTLEEFRARIRKLAEAPRPHAGKRTKRHGSPEPRRGYPWPTDGDPGPSDD